jgi:hypothetical protein
MTSAITGVIGPPHKGQFFLWPNDERDNQWWLGIRLAYVRVSEEGFGEPLATMDELLRTALGDFSTIARSTFPSVVD